MIFNLNMTSQTTSETTQKFLEINTLNQEFYLNVIWILNN